MKDKIPANPDTEGSQWFQTTRWSVVLSAGLADHPKATQSLEDLCRLYWYPLYAYLRRRDYQIDDAKDLTQQFFARLLTGNRLALANPARGRFRTFLLSSLQNFLHNEWAKRSAHKRGSGFEFVPLEGPDPEDLYAAEPADNRSPELIYDQSWAGTIVTRVFNRLREIYQNERAGLFDALRPYLWAQEEEMSQSQKAAELGISDGALRVAVHRLRRRYRELLREEVARTVADSEEVESELRYLIQVLARDSQ